MSNFGLDLSKESTKRTIDTSRFTDDQRNAYNSIMNWINEPFDSNNYKIALVGAAGTGKTYLIKSIISNCPFSYSVIGLAAPTHKAARVLKASIGSIPVKVNTLQSDMGLRLNLKKYDFDPNNPPFDPQGRVKIGQFKLYIVDEASMINKSLEELLERMCIQNQVKLLVQGDPSQLYPVNENYSKAFNNIKTFKLNQIVRQENDNPVKKLLELLRTDIKLKTFKFLEYISTHKYEVDEGNTKGFICCNRQEFYERVLMQFNDERYANNIDLVRVVAYTNVAVTTWNNFIRRNIILDANRAIITKNDLILSYVTIVDDFLAPVITNGEEYIIKDCVGYVHPKYNIKGFMVTFVAIHGGAVTKPLFVVDHKDINAIRTYLAIYNDKLDKAKKNRSWQQYYDFRNEVLLLINIVDKYDPTKIIVSRDIDYGFAITSHRSQGSTYENVMVDVIDIVYDKNGQPYGNADEINRRLYVACSRCRNKLYLNYG